MSDTSLYQSMMAELGFNEDDRLYFVGTGEPCSIIRFDQNENGVIFGIVQVERYGHTKLSSYNISHLRNGIITNNTLDIDNKRFLKLTGQDDVCSKNGCMEKTSRMYCDKCRKDREAYFKEEYYEKMGWELSDRKK